MYPTDWSVELPIFQKAIQCPLSSGSLPCPQYHANGPYPGSWIQSLQSCPICIWGMSPDLHLGLPSGLMPQEYVIKTLCIANSSRMCYTLHSTLSYWLNTAVHCTSEDSSSIFSASELIPKAAYLEWSCSINTFPFRYMWFQFACDALTLSKEFNHTLTNTGDSRKTKCSNSVSQICY